MTLAVIGIIFYMFKRKQEGVLPVELKEMTVKTGTGNELKVEVIKGKTVVSKRCPSGFHWDKVYKRCKPMPWQK